MSETVWLVGATVAWFTPLAAIRVFENAFGLGYTSVNVSGLSLTLAFLSLLSLVYMVLPKPAELGLLVSIGNALGCLTLIIASAFLTSLDKRT